MTDTPGLKARLRTDLTASMKARDTLVTGTLRMALAAITTAEVAGDTALQAGRHRHALRLIRVRTDLAPEDVELV